MKRKLAFLLALISCITIFTACKEQQESSLDKDSSSSNQEPTHTIEYITHFDGYNQCVIFPATRWSTHLYEGGTVVNDWIDGEEYPQFVKEGSGSIKVSMFTPAGNYDNPYGDGNYWYTGKIESQNIYSKIVDVNGATRVSLDVYNPEDKEIVVTVEIRSATETMISATAVCAPKQWTTVATDIEGKKYDNVTWYAIKMENKVDKRPFTLYLDNFYLEFYK